MTPAHVLEMCGWTAVYAPAVPLVVNGCMVNSVVSDAKSCSNMFLSCFTNQESFFLLLFFLLPTLFIIIIGNLKHKERKTQCYINVTFWNYSPFYTVSSWFEKSHHFRLDFWRFSTCYYHSAVTLKNRTLPLKWLSYSFNITCSLNMWFSGNSDCKASSWNTGDLGLIPESRRSAGEGNGYPLHYSYLDNSLDRGAWWATVHGVTRVRQLSELLGAHTLSQVMAK